MNNLIELENRERSKVGKPLIANPDALRILPYEHKPKGLPYWAYFVLAFIATLTLLVLLLDN